MPEPKRMTCIVCPRGCTLVARPGAGGEAAVEGAGCRRGAEYARRELADPRRVLTSTVRAESKAMPRLPVRTSGPIPLPRLRSAARALDDLVARPPLRSGEAICRDWLGLGIDLLATDDLEVES